MSIKTTALIFSNQEARWIKEGYKKIIAKMSSLGDISEPIAFVCDSKIFALAKLDGPQKVSVDKFNKLYDYHRITDDHRKRKWESRKEFLLYKISAIDVYEKSLEVLHDGNRVFFTTFKDGTLLKQRVTDKPWNGDKSRFSIEQLQRAVPQAVRTWANQRARAENRDVIKGDLKLPFKEPNGTINLGGVRAALAALGGARGGVNLPDSVKSAARSQLQGILERSSKNNGNSEKRFQSDSYLNKRIRIIKTDHIGEERTVLGIVLEPETTDGQGDIYNEEVIRFSAHKFMEEFQNMGLMHEEIRNDEIKILESFLAPVDFEIEGQMIKKGTWLMRARIIADNLWKSVKAGELTGFSIGGLATSEAVE